MKDIKVLADDYAHCYAFAGDDAMKDARERLHDALDEAATLYVSLESAIECMRCAGGREEFQAAFDHAKSLVRTTGGNPHV